MVQRSEGRRLGDLALFTGRRVLALGQSVDLVVEHQDLQVDVPPERVDQVVPADGERVAVSRDHPDMQVRAGRGDPRGDGRSASMDPVHAVGVDVVGEPPRTADAADEHGLLRGHAELREEGLHRRQDRVVAAARTPPDLLVAGEVLLGQCGSRRGRCSVSADRLPILLAHQPSLLRISSSTSWAWMGCPWTLVKLSTSIRNLARRIMASCPRFISGNNTLG